jgi:hypothetical protein
MLHLEHAAVEFRRAHRHGAADLRRREARHRVLAGFERADDAVEPRNFSHSQSPLIAASS